MTIHVDNLVKHYRVHRREAGLRESLRSLFHREYETVRAVDGISFQIEQGEVVGFLGANGAGKTTTLKCLAGLLYPTCGTISVMGYTPHQRREAYLKSFTLVMGSRNQLMWDLPAIETFLVNQAIYDIPEAQFRQMLDELVTLLDLDGLLTKQVRKLSLGERMKCELVASLLHHPKVIFLDEPTLGLDVTAQAAVRDFIRAYNRKYQATVLLTSHYMADVTALASRILVIERGKLIYDGHLQQLIERTAPYKLLKLTLEKPVDQPDLAALGTIDKLEGLNVTLRVARHAVKEAAACALNTLPIADMTIEEPVIEEIIQQVFKRET
jgi:ABC-2 type transport system ATP-binding protein